MGINPIGPGPARVLLALWDYAWDWKPGRAPPFVFPGVDALARKLGLGRSTVYHNLGKLREAGWIRETRQDARDGWTLALMPTIARAVEDEEPRDEMQLGFAWSHDDEADDAANDSKPVDIMCTTEEPASTTSPNLRTAPSAPSESHPLQEANMKQPQDVGQEMLRIFHAYEQHRHTALGGPEPRRLPPPSMVTLWRELGGNGAASKKLEAYGRRAIEIVAKLKADDAPDWREKARWRSDGGEWSRKRYDAVMAWQGVAAEPCTPTPPPAPDPIVDGVRVDLHEREAWERGGAEAVRRQRAEALAPERMATLAGDFLATLRKVGGA